MIITDEDNNKTSWTEKSKHKLSYSIFSFTIKLFKDESLFRVMYISMFVLLLPSRRKYWTDLVEVWNGGSF